MKRALIPLGFVLLLLVLPRDVEACSCMVPGPPKDAFEKADLVFLGKADEVVGAELGPKTIRFTVTEAFRGLGDKDVKEVKLRSRGGGSAACEFTFNAGQEYLVYAYKRDDGTWETNICTRTRQRRFAEEDLKYLRSR